MQLSNKQLDALRNKGLTDEDIKTYADKYGYTLPPTAQSTARKIGEDIRSRTTKIVDTAKRLATGKQTLLSAEFDIGGQAFGAVGDTVSNVGDAITPAPIKNALERVGLAAAKQPVVKALMAKAQAFYDTLDDDERRHLDAALGYVSGASSVAGGGVAGKAATSVAAPVARAAGKTLTVAARATKSTGKALNASGFTPNVAEAERIIAYKANTPFLKRALNAVTGNEDPGKPRLKSDTALEQGVAGTEKIIGITAKRKADKLWNEKIAPAVRDSEEIMTKEELFAPAVQLVESTTDPTRKKALKAALDALYEDYADADGWSLEVAQALKRDLAKFLPSKMYRGQDVASEIRTLQYEMAHAIRQKTYEALDDVNIKKDYLDWANLAALEQIGVKAISEAKLKGGFGSFWTAMWDMTTTPIKTVGGQVLYRVGNSLEFIGEKGITNFGDFLKRRGFLPPPSSSEEQ